MVPKREEGNGRSVLNKAVVVSGLLRRSGHGQPIMKSELIVMQGQSVGMAIYHRKHGVEIALDVKGSPPGEERADSLRPDRQGRRPRLHAAGRDFNPTMKKYGTENLEGPYYGDMNSFQNACRGGVARRRSRPHRVSLGLNAYSLFERLEPRHHSCDGRRHEERSGGNAGARIARGDGHEEAPPDRRLSFCVRNEGRKDEYGSNGNE